MSEININLILSILALGSAIFAIYKYFRTPDEKADKSITILDRELAEQKRLAAEAVKTTQNCIKTLETKIDIQSSGLSDFGNRLTRLETIIDERIPRKI